MTARDTTAPTVDVVVVTYNPGETIKNFLGSVPGASTSLGSVVVVDNASRDDGPQRAAADAGATFVQTGRNAGYGTAANAGAREGQAPWILVSNADILLGAGAVDALVLAGEVDPGIGAVGPLVRELDGSVYPSARPLPRLVMGAAHAVLSRAWPKNPWTRRYLVPLDPGKGARAAEWLSGSCFLVRRTAWEAVGGFDEQFFMFFEDVDLGRRLGRAGYSIVWEPAAEVKHVGGHTWRSNPAPMLKAHHESARRYVALAYPKWWHAPARALAATVLSARQKAEIARAARKGTLDD